MDTLVTAAVIIGKDDTVLASQRAYPAALRGRYEFAGGKVEAGESRREALVRELVEELGARVRIGPALDNPCSPDGLWPLGPHIRMATYWATLSDGSSPQVTGAHLAHTWHPRTTLATLDWLEPDLPIARLLERTPPPMIDDK